MTLLRVRGLRHAYGEFAVLKELTFDLAAGKALALVGPNGSGKSTLLRCVTGAIEPAGGDVRLDDRPLDETDPRVRAKVATMLDDIDFFPDLTVAEHLDLLARAHGVADAQDTVDQVLDELGIARNGDQFPGTLSSGQRHRLTLAACFVRPADLLLLDEPEHRLDEQGRSWLADRLHRAKAAGAAILFASHSPDLVDAVADDVLRLGSTRCDPADAVESGTLETGPLETGPLETGTAHEARS